MVSDWPFFANNPLQKITKIIYKPHVFRTEMYKRNVPINVVFLRKEDQSWNQIFSSKIIYFQGGSASEYTNVKNNVSAFYYSAIKRKKNRRNTSETANTLGSCQQILEIPLQKLSAVTVACEQIQICKRIFNDSWNNLSFIILNDKERNDRNCLILNTSY